MSEDRVKIVCLWWTSNREYRKQAQSYVNGSPVYQTVQSQVWSCETEIFSIKNV